MAIASLHINRETRIDVGLVIFGRKRERNHKIL